MSEYLLLKNLAGCPSCRRLAAPQRLPGVCRNCGVMLFGPDDNYERFQEETGVREYYVYNTTDGWVHQTQLKERRANSRVYVPPKLPDDYGKKTPEEMAAEAYQKTMKGEL